MSPCFVLALHELELGFRDDVLVVYTASKPSGHPLCEIRVSVHRNGTAQASWTPWHGENEALRVIDAALEAAIPLALDEAVRIRALLALARRGPRL